MATQWMRYSPGSLVFVECTRPLGGALTLGYIYRAVGEGIGLAGPFLVIAKDDSGKMEAQYQQSRFRLLPAGAPNPPAQKPSYKAPSANISELIETLRPDSPYGLPPPHKANPKPPTGMLVFSCEGCSRGLVEGLDNTWSKDAWDRSHCIKCRREAGR